MAVDDCAALLFPDIDRVVAAPEPPEDEDLDVLFIVRPGLADMILARILDRYALPVRESNPDDEIEELWLGAAILEDE